MFGFLKKRVWQRGQKLWKQNNDRVEVELLAEEEAKNLSPEQSDTETILGPQMDQYELKQVYLRMMSNDGFLKPGGDAAMLAMNKRLQRNYEERQLNLCESFEKHTTPALGWDVYFEQQFQELANENAWWKTL